MRKNIGQHFIRSGRVARSVVDAAPIQTSLVVEVGPGKGVLTEHLLAAGHTVVAVEKDAHLVSYLQERFTAEITDGKLIIHSGDVRDDGWFSLLGGLDYTVVANIPYYLTGSLIRALLTHSHPPKAMTLVVQKEVAERITERRDGKESLLSLSVQLFGKAHYIKTLPRRLFSPAPAVDSAVITITSISAPPQSVQNAFFDIIRIAFHQKRKTVLKKFLYNPLVHAALAVDGVSDSDRAEDVPFSVWYGIAENLHKNGFGDGND